MFVDMFVFRMLFLMCFFTSNLQLRPLSHLVQAPNSKFELKKHMRKKGYKQASNQTNSQSDCMEAPLWNKGASKIGQLQIPFTP